MLWIKSFHILFVMAWLTGVFYLPRIFVHYAEGRAAGEDVRRLVIMARRLYGFMTIMALLAVGFGIWLMLAYGYARPLARLEAGVRRRPGRSTTSSAARFTQRMQQGAPLPGSVALRFLNEATLLLVVPILILVTVKPFG